MRTDVYLDDRYTAFINALINVPPSPVTGERTFDQVQQVLCDFDVWPGIDPRRRDPRGY